MRIISYLLLVFITTNAFAQTDAEIKLDLLKAPVSPASNLLGISPSDIDKPTDVSAFMLNLQSATSGFTSLPKNYSVDIAPYWLFVKPGRREDYTTEGLRKSSGKGVFKQTFILSAAIRNPDSSDTYLNRESSYAGFGLKFSIFRGRYDETTSKGLAAIKAIQDTKLEYLGTLMSKWLKERARDVEFKRLDDEQKKLFPSNPTPEEVRTVQTSKKYIELEIQKTKRMNDFIYNEADKERLDALDKRIEKVAATFQTARIGWTWDVSAGISSEFMNKKFDSSRVNNAGIWTTFGYTDSSFGSLLGLVRYLHNPDKIFAKDNIANMMGDISTLDAGVRYIWSKPQSKFNLSLEAIYRSVLSSNTIDPSWRVVLNADYSIWQNQKLTFSFGRNFDGVISKGGNLIAGLSFLTGFGNKR
ncbi:hypothetical protein [Aridibaculum aurantiacum]|uniref:hypothetical protein n=1 Tax=Aridibaculum aurantiacum TaxID=2810307 RepID=UPI001A961514|nr:hypothetical protein [Aridibaculum aurantiacum]